MKRILMTGLCLAACAQPAPGEPVPTSNQDHKTSLHTARRAVSLYPAERSSVTDRSCRPYNGECVRLTTPQPALTLRDFSYRLSWRGKPEIVLQLSARDRQRLARATAKMKQGSLAMMSKGGRVLHVGKVRGAIDTDKVSISFCNRSNYKRLVRHLAGR